MLPIRNRILTLAAIITSLAASATATKIWAVDVGGFGPVKVGMSLAQLSTVLHGKFSMPTTKEERECFYINPKHDDFSVMIERGHVARIDVNKAGVVTSKGIQVGDSEAHALEVYGSKLKVEPHTYTDQGHYLTLRDGRYGIRFETDKGKITSFYAGKFSAIQYVEGCL